MSMFDLIKGGKAFSNPLAGPIGAVGSSVSGILDSAAFLTLTPEEQISMTDAVSQFETQLGEFGTHTNRLSGVDLSGQVNILTAGQIGNSAKNALKSDSCDSLNNIFGSITKALSFINQFAQLQELIMAFLNNPSGLVNQLLNAINTQISTLANQIQSDLLAFAEAQLTALQYALSEGIFGLLGDPCTSSVMSKVMTDAAKNQVQTSIGSIPNVPRL